MDVLAGIGKGICWPELVRMCWQGWQRDVLAGASENVLAGIAK